MYFENKQSQPELFDELPGPNKLRRRRLGSIKKLTITTSYELVLLIFILLLMTIILSFAIGFERGKFFLNSKGADSEESSGLVSISQQSGVKESKPILSTLRTSTTGEEESRTKTHTSQNAEKKFNYAIQLITYTQKSYAEREMEKLRKSGYSPFTAHKNKFYIVYIGPYPDKKEANSILKKIKSQFLYHDAFIKKSK